MLDQTEHDISTVHKKRKYQKSRTFLAPKCFICCIHLAKKCQNANRGWHFNIDEQEKLMPSRDKHTQKREFRNIVARPEPIKCPMPMRPMPMHGLVGKYEIWVENGIRKRRHEKTCPTSHRRSKPTA